MDIQRQDLARARHGWEQYGDSWFRRGGAGAYMVTMRKADRIEHALSGGRDVFEELRKDTRAEGLIDDIRDLRTYLTMIEAQWLVPLRHDVEHYVENIHEIQETDLNETALQRTVHETVTTDGLLALFRGLDDFVRQFDWDIFEALSKETGVLLAVRWTRRKLWALETQARSLGICHDEAEK